MFHTRIERSTAPPSPQMGDSQMALGSLHPVTALRPDRRIGQVGWRSGTSGCPDNRVAGVHKLQFDPVRVSLAASAQRHCRRRGGRPSLGIAWEHRAHPQIPARLTSHRI